MHVEKTLGREGWVGLGQNPTRNLTQPEAFLANPTQVSDFFKKRNITNLLTNSAKSAWKMPNKSSIQDPAWAKFNTGDPQDTQILVTRNHFTRAETY